MIARSYANRETEPKSKRKDDEMKAYIYGIKNIKNNKFYVGQTSQQKSKREWKHFFDLDNNNHHSIKLQNDYNYFGKECFITEVLEELNDVNIIKDRENYWINKLDSINNGYNMMRGGGGVLTESTKNNLSTSHIGNISNRRVLNDNDAMNLYSMIYFYGKIIRPLSKISGIGRDVIKSVCKDYSNVREMFDKFDIKIKYEIFKQASKIYSFDVKQCTYLPDNVFYLVHYYNELYSKKDISIIFNISIKSVENILNGKVKPQVYREYTDGIIDKEKLSILFYLNKTINKGNPVPSLERNFFEG